MATLNSEQHGPELRAVITEASARGLAALESLARLKDHRGEYSDARRAQHKALVNGKAAQVSGDDLRAGLLVLGRDDEAAAVSRWAEYLIHPDGRYEPAPKEGSTE